MNESLFEEEVRVIGVGLGVFFEALVLGENVVRADDRETGEEKIPSRPLRKWKRTVTS